MKQPEVRLGSSSPWRSRIAVAIACLGLSGVAYEMGRESQDATIQQCKSETKKTSD